MNQLLKNRESFLQGQIDKGTFIRTMFEEHARLFAYPDFMASTNIAELKIRPEGIVADFKRPRISMLCPPGDMRIPPIEALNFGDYELFELETIRRVVELLGGASARFLDIGANAGFYSLALSHYFPGIQGTAFEPVPRTFAYLEENLRLNGVKTVQALNIGLSDSVGELIFYTYPSQSAAASMTRNLESVDVEEIRCRVVRLDDHLSTDNAPIHFIKCDVEGAELAVFQGAEKIISRDFPVIFTEMLRKWCAKYNYHPNDIIHFLGQLGYQCYAIQEADLVPCEVVSEQTVETNFLFLHGTRHAALFAGLT